MSTENELTMNDTFLIVDIADDNGYTVYPLTRL